MIAMFWWLLVGHAIADYPLQTDFIAKFKSHKNSLAAVPWYYVLASHALTHGAAVSLATSSVFLGMLEAALHFGIDFLKNDGRTSIHMDQCLHVACKLAYVTILM